MLLKAVPKFHLPLRDCENVQNRSEQTEIGAQKIRLHKNIESKHPEPNILEVDHRQDYTIV
jgi:hypothetical protein